jgi:hypothetical protein
MLSHCLVYDVRSYEPEIMDVYEHTDIYICTFVVELEPIHALTTEHTTLKCIHCGYSLKNYVVFECLIRQIKHFFWHAFVCMCLHAYVSVHALDMLIKCEYKVMK